MSTLGIIKADRGVRAATGARDKAIRLAGIESESVMEQAFKNKVAIPAESFGMFWGRVEDKPKELGLMATVLLKKVVELLNANAFMEKSATESKEEKQLPPELLASMSTISFLALYFPCSSVTNPKQLLAHLEPYYEDELNLTRRLPTIKEPMRLMRASIEGVDLLGMALIGASTLHTLSEFNSLSSITDFPTVDANSPVTIEGSFWYEWLRDTSLESEAKRINVLTGLTSKMLTLPQQMKMNTLIAFSTGVALFHMFLNIFSMKPVTDSAFLHRAYSIVSQLYLWPLPIGALARDTMLLIQKEMVWPGAAMVAVLEQECRVGQQEIPGTSGARNRCLYYFYDPAFEGARLLFKDVMRASAPLDKEVRAKTGPWKRRPSHQLKNRPEEAPRSTRLHSVGKALIMMNMLANESALTEAEAKTISEVNPGTIDSEYEKLTIARKELESTQQPLAVLADKRKEILAGLKKTLLAAKPGGQVAEFPLAAPYTCFLPLVEHVAIETEVEFEPTPQTPKASAQLLCLSYIPLPQPPQVYDHLEYILHQHAMEPKPCEARVMICGGDKSLYGMLCAYLHLCQLAPPSFSGIYFKFYLLPFGDNMMAQYLARMDGWYRRHVYKPCMARSLVIPWLAPGGESKKEDEYGIPMIGRFLRETFTSYAREARSTLNVRVWIVKGWVEYEQKQEAEPKGGKVDKLANHPDFSIPFISYCEIGVQAQAEEYRKKKKLKSTVEEIIAVSSEKSGFVFNPPEIAVEFTPVDLRGHSLAHVEDDPEKYRSIVLRNVPKAGEKAFPANPQSGSLELGAVFATAKAAAAYSKNLLATEPFQRVGGARISCSGPRATFHIVCDGESFGPFHHIVVEPARHPLNSNSTTYGGNQVATGDVVTFPIQCFSPIVD